MKKKNKEVDYEKIGRIVYGLGESSIYNKRLYKVAFLKGLFAGFGSVIGATLVVSLMLWLFTILGDVPLIGTVVDIIRDSIDQTNSP